MDNSLAQQAVSFALNGNWPKALEVNKTILKNDKKDVEALNRLARAYAELGDLNKARLTAKQVIRIDPFNSIATKSLNKWRSLKNGDIIKSGPSTADAFLEEPGKTKLVSLLHVCRPEILARLDSGDELRMNTHSHRASINTPDGIHIGKLPDDLSAHLRNLIKYGNEYKVLVKSIEPGDVKVFIKEVKRSEKLQDIPSFTTEKIEYVSFTPPELVHKKDTSAVITEEE